MATTRETAADVVERYLEGLGSRDLSSIPFAPDVVFECPLAQRISGPAVLEFLAGMLPAINGVRVKQHIEAGEYCATAFDLDTAYGVIPVFGKFRVVAGKLRSISPYYDPTPIIQAA